MVFESRLPAAHYRCWWKKRKTPLPFLIHKANASLTPDKPLQAFQFGRYLTPEWCSEPRFEGWSLKLRNFHCWWKPNLKQQNYTNYSRSWHILRESFMKRKSAFTMTSFLNQNRQSWWLREGKVQLLYFLHLKKIFLKKHLCSDLKRMGFLIRNNKILKWVCWTKKKQL